MSIFNREPKKPSALAQANDAPLLLAARRRVGDKVTDQTPEQTASDQPQVVAESAGAIAVTTSTGSGVIDRQLRRANDPGVPLAFGENNRPEVPTNQQPIVETEDKAA